jgi:hypothetical protein
VYFRDLIVISTSPSLQTFPLLAASLTSVFKASVESEKEFVHNHILGSFVSIVWTSHATESTLSDPVSAWVLYISRLVLRLKDLKSQSQKILTIITEYSVAFFVGYYGAIQPTKERSVNLRKDIFAIVDAVVKYGGSLTAVILKQLWYLLYVVAISGSDASLLAAVQVKDCGEKEQPFLGLSRNDTDFTDYKEALARLGKKFESELSTFPKMVEFVRANY